MRCGIQIFATFLAVLCLVSALSSAAPLSVEDIRGGKRTLRLEEQPLEELDQHELSVRGRTVLNMDGMKWKHAQTDHFVFHYDRSTFATKVARMAEFFYDHIAEELEASKDRASGRSHIFIFRNEKDWKEFMREANISTEWAFSLVQGKSMYLQQADNTKDSGSVLAHEMTHLVMNRFFSGRAPIWLNEGLAEWYEEFGYAAFKGTKKSQRSQFRQMRRRVPVADLVQMISYPTVPEDIHAFYETSKFLVGYLMLNWEPGKIIPFTEDLIAGKPLTTALQTHYDIASLDELEKGFDAFVR